MSDASATTSAEPAARLGVATARKDPAELSVRLAAEAVRQVHDADGVAPDAALVPRADPGVPGANYVDVNDGAGGAGAAEGPSHPRYWVGMAGEVVPTATEDPHLRRNPDQQRARTRYTAAVEAVRLRHRVPVCEELFAVPDTFVAGAFFVHDTAQEPLVRWVDADGGVHDGYRLVGGEPRWDAATVTARRAALAAEPATRVLLD